MNFAAFYLGFSICSLEYEFNCIKDWTSECFALNKLLLTEYLLNASIVLIV